MIKKYLVLTAALLLFTTSFSPAEVISIADPRYEVSNAPEGVIRPVQGMSMAIVEQKFGQPEHKSAPKGEPPITRWTYGEFVVFFEHNLVIDSVVPHKQ